MADAGPPGWYGAPAYRARYVGACVVLMQGDSEDRVAIFENRPRRGVPNGRAECDRHALGVLGDLDRGLRAVD